MCCAASAEAFAALVAANLSSLALDYVVLDLFEEKYGFADPMSGSEQVGAAQFLPAEGSCLQHPDDFLRREGHERFDGDREVCGDLQSDVQDRLDPFGIGFDEFPRFGVGQVFIAQAGDVHRLLQGFAEPVVFDVVFEGFLRAGEFPKRFAVVVRQCAAGGHCAVEVFVCQD